MAIFLFISVSCFASDSLTVPIHFKNYQEIFKYIADENEGEGDPEYILELAADSRVDYLRKDHTKGTGDMIVITANYIDKKEFFGIDMIRGAQGNGSFYVFQKNDDGYDLIGILSGNGYKFAQVNGKDSVLTSWHVSASEYTETLYQWDGKVYRLISSKEIVNSKDN